VAASIEIRAAGRADAQAIARVQQETWRTTYAGILPLDVITSMTGRRDAREWAKRLDSRVPDTCTWIAQRAGKVIGFASCGPARADVEGLGGEIYALYVLQSEQRRGVGRELVRSSARHFVRHGIFGMFLWVLKANRARLFYETMGGEEMREKMERLGQHDFAEIAYGWRDLTALVVDAE
jgi:ribosomal protein S18 acetylase RimI-like enzyme